MYFVILFSFFIFPHFAYDLDYEKVRLLDWKKFGGITNFIFRGDEPKITNSSGEFVAYKELILFMQKRAAEQNVSFPKKYYLIDIKLVYFSWEPDVAMEEQFFEDNPQLGEFQLKHIYGDLTSPQIYPQSYVEEEAKTLSSWSMDDLPDFIASLYTLLSTPGNSSTLIYFHCACGCDRTGEVAGSYMMRYKNYSFPKADAWDDEVAGRWILPNHRFAMEWYCEYLYYALNFNTVTPCTD